MKRKELEREGKKWVDEGIITTTQFKQILDKYPKKEQHYLLITFAGIFIGLGFLTFVASNWSAITNLGKMSIIILAMLGFYLSGEKYYQKGAVSVGVSFFSIGLLIFGAGIFLTGQMYHYTFYNALPFFIWGLASLLLYWSRQETGLLTLSLIIISVGQLYEALTYDGFNIGIFILLIAWFSLYSIFYKGRGNWLGYLFGLSFASQTFILSLSEFYYLMFIPFLLLLYIFSDIGFNDKMAAPFRAVAIFLIFFVNSVHVFIFGWEFIFEGLEFGMLFHISISVLFIAALVLKWYKKDFQHLADLVLFLPVVYLGSLIDFASLLLLFAFSITYLVIGYQHFDQRKVNVGTASFLVSTILAYVQLAWDFLDKSLFFFIGGIFLFLLSYFLEKRRRHITHKQGGGRG